MGQQKPGTTGIEPFIVSGLEDGSWNSAAWKPSKQEVAVMLTLAVVSLMVALDATILVPVLPTLASELNGTAIDAFWAGTAYLLPSAVLQPFIAALSDIFGRKEVLMISLVFFSVGTALCAPIATDFTILLIGRSLQGVGGGGLITMCQVIYADIVPLRQRPKYFAIQLAAWAIGSVLGPWVGGILVENVSWRWCFYINFPFCGLAIILVPIFVKLKTERSSLGSKLARVDWVGGFLFVGGMTSLLIGISWAGIQFEWLSYQTLAPIGVGLLSVLTTVVWERYGAREPFLRGSLFVSVSALAAYTCAFCQGFLLFCGLYYTPFYFQAVRFATPTQAGMDLFPVTCLLVPGSVIVSVLTSRLGRFRWAIWLGFILTTTGCGLLRLLDQDTSTPVWAGIMCVFGVGNGMVLASVNVGIQAISRVEDAGRAASMYAFMRTTGMSVGVAVGGTVFQNVMASKLAKLKLPDSIAHNSEAFVGKMAKMAPTDPVRVGALLAYVEGFHGVFWVMTVTAGLGLLASLLIKSHTMDKALDSKFTLEGVSGVRTRAELARQRMSRMSRGVSMLMMPGQHGNVSVPEWPEDGSRRNSDSGDVGMSLVDKTRKLSEPVRVMAFYVQPHGRRTPVEITAAPSPPSSSWSKGPSSAWLRNQYRRKRQQHPPLQPPQMPFPAHLAPWNSESRLGSSHSNSSSYTYASQDRMMQPMHDVDRFLSSKASTRSRGGQSARSVQSRRY